MNKELRYCDITRAMGEESRRVEGYAAVFDKDSQDLGGFIERIAPGAFDGVIASSDVMAVLNHDQSRGILARSTNGEGSLTLTIDENGLKYTFDAPHTALGDELLEGLSRGDIRQSSFAFCVDADKWEKRAEGGYIRTITKVSRLFDVSPVYTPAYPDTSVARRSLDNYINTNNNSPEMEKDEKKVEVVNQTIDNSEVINELRAIGETLKSLNEKELNAPKAELEMRVLNTEYKASDVSIMRALRSLAEGRALDGVMADINARGLEQMPKGTLASNHLFVPDYRSVVDTSTGANAIATDLQKTLAPLYNSEILNALGVTRLSGLRGNVQIPAYSGVTASFVAENEAVTDGGGSFGAKTLSPYRLAAYVPISKTFLAQDSASAEAVIRESINRSVNAAVEQQLFSKSAGTKSVSGENVTVAPKGLLNGVTDDTAVKTYKDFVELETALKKKKFVGANKYALSIEAEGYLRTLGVGTSTNAFNFVINDGKVINTPYAASGNIIEKGLLYGDWSQLYIGQWGGLDFEMQSDPIRNQWLLVVNMYLDAKVVRDNAISAVVLKTQA